MSRRRRAGATLVVDWTRCTGQGVCAAALGEQVSLDQWGYPLGASTQGSVQLDADDRAAAVMAVRSCPTMALHLRTARLGAD